MPSNPLFANPLGDAASGTYQRTAQGMPGTRKTPPGKVSNLGANYAAQEAQAAAAAQGWQDSAGARRPRMADIRGGGGRGVKAKPTAAARGRAPAPAGARSALATATTVGSLIAPRPPASRAPAGRAPASRAPAATSVVAPVAVAPGPAPVQPKPVDMAAPRYDISAPGEAGQGRFHHDIDAGIKVGSAFEGMNVLGGPTGGGTGQFNFNHRVDMAAPAAQTPAEWTGIDKGELEQQRSAAFRGGRDSIGGMRAVKELYAQKLGLDPAKANTYSMRDLEAQVDARNSNSIGGRIAAQGGAGATLEAPVISDVPQQSALGRQTLNYSGSDGRMSAAVPQEAAKQLGDLQGIWGENVMSEAAAQPNPAFMDDKPGLVDASQFQGLSGGAPVVNADSVNGYMQSSQFKDSLVRPTDQQMFNNSPVTVLNAPDRGRELAAYGAIGQKPPIAPGEELQSQAFGVRSSKPGATIDLGYRDPKDLPPLNSGLRRMSGPSEFGYKNPTPSFSPAFDMQSALFRQTR